jgi:hypothetical protein
MLAHLVSGFWVIGILKFSEKIKIIQMEFEKSLQYHNINW